MIHYEQGDVFANLPKACIFVHGCNAQRTMGSGVAKVIKDRYPEVYCGYLTMVMKLGQVSMVKLGEQIFCNAITQQYYGRDPNRCYVDYRAVEDALAKVAYYARTLELPVYMPFIGGGLGGGDRLVLSQIFKEVFNGIEVHIFSLESAPISA
jgi:hypothetical protein